MSVKEGYLDVKQSGGPLPKRWTKCYVMLKADGIYYFKEKKSKTPLDTLLWAKVQSVEAIGKDDENVFQVKTPTSVTLHVCASADDKRSWLSLINKMRTPLPTSRKSRIVIGANKTSFEAGLVVFLFTCCLFATSWIFHRRVLLQNDTVFVLLNVQSNHSFLFEQHFCGNFVVILSSVKNSLIRVADRYSFLLCVGV
jgi:hypothetical protein